LRMENYEGNPKAVFTLQPRNLKLIFNFLPEASMDHGKEGQFIGIFGEFYPRMACQVRP